MTNHPLTQRSAASSAFSADFQGVGRSSSAWAAKVMELAERGVTIRELLTFYRASAGTANGVSVSVRSCETTHCDSGEGWGRLGEVGFLT